MKDIRRFTTPDQDFEFDIDPEVISYLLITYTQKGEIVLEKTKDDLTFFTSEEDGKTKYLGSFTLSQEETSGFNIHDHIMVQARAVTIDGRAFVSEIYEVDVYDVLNPVMLGGDNIEQSV